MITSKNAGVTILVTNLDQGSSQQGLDITVGINVKISFPDYPEGADPALLPTVYYTYDDGALIPIFGSELNTVLPAGVTKFVLTRDYNRTDAKDYGPNTKRTHLLVDIEENAATVGYEGPHLYELIYDREDDHLVTLQGQVTTTPFQMQALEFYKLGGASSAMATHFSDVVGVPATDDKGNISKLFRTESTFDPIPHAETLWFTPNLGNYDENKTGLHDKRHGRDIPFWVKEDYTPLFFTPALGPMETGETEEWFLENNGDLLNGDFSELFYVEHRMGANWVRTPYDTGADWAGYPSDSQLFNQAYNSFPVNTLKEDIFAALKPLRVPAGASGLRITFYPQFYAFWRECFTGDVTGYVPEKPFPTGKLGWSSCFLMHCPRGSFGDRENRAFPTRTSIWFTMDETTFVNVPDASLSVPSIMMEDGRVLLTENSMVLTPEANVNF